MKLSKGLNIICLFLLFVYSAQSQQPRQQQTQRQQSHQQRHHAKKLQQLARTKKIYAMCPPSFSKIGNECYYLSPTKASWLDSHFECKDKNSKLAEPMKYGDRLLRKYFMERGRTRGEIWIGGMYNWQRHKWQWGYNGKDMTYQSFSQMKPGGSEDLKYNCAVLNPDLKYRWSAKLCFEKHFYLCQHRMPYVSERSRQKIYAKWNETFPGQFANEVQVYVTTNGSDGNRKEYYRATSKRPDAANRVSPSRDQVAEASNQVPSTTRYRVISNEINPPEVVSSRDAANQSKLRRNKKQQINKGRENKTLKLTGNVDLGSSVFRQSKQLRRKSTRKLTTPTTTSTQHPNTISEVFQPNHHRHNHYETRQQTQKAHKPPTTSTPYPSTYPTTDSPSTSTARAYFTESTSSVPAFNTTALAAKLLEKKQRLENVRSKLSKLTDEEKLEFMKLKAERRARKNKSINDTIP